MISLDNGRWFILLKRHELLYIRSYWNACDAALYDKCIKYKQNKKL